MKLILLRHGRTEANERRLYCGHTDLPLTDAGRAELQELRAKGDYPSCEGFLKITSGLRRADETLQILFDVQAGLILPELQEMHFGRFEMHSYEELKSDPDYQAWISDESGTLPTPGGESAREFRERVLRAGNGIARDSLIVCHGGVIAALMAHWFPEEGRNLYQWQPGSGRGYAVELEGDERSFEIIPKLAGNSYKNYEK